MNAYSFAEFGDGSGLDSYQSSVPYGGITLKLDVASRTQVKGDAFPYCTSGTESQFAGARNARREVKNNIFARFHTMEPKQPNEVSSEMHRVMLPNRGYRIS